MNKRLFAILLCLVMIVGLMPFGAFAVADTDTAVTAADTTTASSSAAAGDLTYLAFTSDVHHGTSDANSANRLNGWLKSVAGKIGDDIDVMNFCGDFGSASANESQYWQYAQAVLDAATNSGVVHDKVYTTGNHEFYNGKYASSTNSVKNGFTRLGEARNASNYIIYAFGVHDWDSMSDHYDTDDIGKLDSYLGGLSSSDQTKPIFILTHFPIHSFQSRRTSNADQVVKVLNKYADKGYDIYYLWGHNHTVADTHYDHVYTGSIEGTAINFTYLAAGCMADKEYGQSAAVKGKGLVIGIDGKEVKSMTYYDLNGNALNSQGGSDTPSQPSQPSGTTPESGKQYLIICDGHALTTGAGESYSNGSSGQTYNYTGLAGTNYSSGMTITSDMVWTFTSSGSGYVISNSGKYLNGYYASNDSGGSNGDLKLESSQKDVWTLSGNTLKSTNGSSGASSDKFLAYGNGAESTVNTFSVRSAPSSNNSNVVNTLTFIEVKDGQAVEPSTPTVTPGETTSSVSVTPSTDNPEKSATINVGDTLTINVTNGSSSNAYDFSVSVGSGSVAQVQGSSSANIGAGNTTAFTVKGLAAGTTDITIQNSNSYGSQYTRKAVIHLTVVEGGAAPTEQPGTDTQVPITPSTDNPEKSATIKVGDTLAINVTNGSSNASYDFTATVVNSSIAQIQGSSSVNLGTGATGTITVKGLAVGTTDITISNNNTQYGDQYVRKGVIHLTVVEGSVTPTPVPGCAHENVVLSGKKSPTCTEKGYTGDHICLSCGEIIEKGEDIAALGHKTVVKNAKDPTCTEKGYSGDQVCTVCGDTVAKGNEIDALGHKTELKNTKAPTCDEEGYTGDQVCSVCGETVVKGEAIPAEGHELVIRGAKDATCSAEGYTGDAYCKVCGKLVTKGEAIAKLPHTWGEWVQTKAPTEFDEGEETHTCTVCGATETRAVNPLGHNHVMKAVAAQAASCTEDGFEAYWVCEGCHKLFSDAEGANEIEAPVVVKAPGHDTELKDAKEATCTEKGYTGDLVCKVCHEVVQKGTEIDMIAHTLVKHDAKAPTETEPGNIEYWECSVCHKLFADAKGEKEIKLEDTVLDPVKPEKCDGGANCPSIELTDVDRRPTSWYHEAVTTGTTKTTFSPNAECTREQMVTFLWRALGEPKATITSCPFTDVKADDYSYAAILWAYENEVVNGTAKDKFSPRDPVTREQVVTILWRLAEKPATEGTMPFPDVKAGYSYDAIKWAAANNVATGYQDGTFAPTKAVTRAEIVTLLFRYFNK